MPGGPHMSARLSGPGGNRCLRSISSHTLPHQHAMSASVNPQSTLFHVQHVSVEQRRVQQPQGMQMSLERSCPIRQWQTRRYPETSS